MATKALGLYEDYAIYSVDINHHLGNIYALSLDSISGTLSPSVQESISMASGVFDATSARIDPLVGGMPTSLPLSGYVPQSVSLLGILVICGIAIFYAVYRFQRKDIE